MDEYEGEWIETYSGSRFHFINPRPEEIKLGDIAHHLSLICRFTGACRIFYSVADHSIRVARIVPRELKLAALLHDAAETYINDISRPVKYSHRLDEVEKVLTDVIDEKFGINSRHPLISRADSVLMATEARDLMPNTDGWRELPDPLPTKITPMKPKETEALFMRRFYDYRHINLTLQ